jgi:tetratricopeptide (TPR) repeat protein
MQGITRVVQGEIAQFRGDAAAAGRLFAAAAVDFEHEGDRFAYALSITEASELAEMAGDYDRAVEQLSHGIEIAAEVGFSGHPLAMRARLGNIEVLRGNLDVAERHHRELIDDAGAEGVPWLQAMARVGLASIARRRDELDEAEEHLDAAWAMHRSRVVPYMRSLIQVARGYLADQRGRLEEAVGHQRDALEISHRLTMPRGVAYAMEGLAGALALSPEADDQDLAARLLGRADAIRRETGGAMPDAERFDVDRAERRLRAALGDAVVEQGMAAGAATAVDDLVAEVFDALGDPADRD